MLRLNECESWPATIPNTGDPVPNKENGGEPDVPIEISDQGAPLHGASRPSIMNCLASPPPDF